MRERVNVDNFKRAESDHYFSTFTKEGGLGKFVQKLFIWR